MELDKAIQTRYSCKKFSDKKPKWQDIVECIDATRYAPMAGNDFTLKFVIINNPKIIEKMCGCCQQDFFHNVNYIVVACSCPAKTINAYGERGKIYTRQQAGAAIQNFLLKITEKGLATCWVGNFVEDMIRRELKIPDDVFVEAIFPIGYELKKSSTRKIKKDLDKILYFYTWKNKKMNPEKGIDV